MEQNTPSADDLVLFTVIAEQASLVRAAERLGLPKATVSRRLAQLEATLGKRLIQRTTRRLALTDDGRGLLAHSARVAEEVAATRDYLRSEETRPRGRLRVSMPGDLARHRYARAIATFLAGQPEVELELDLSPRRVDLVGEGFDLAIRMGDLEDDANLVARKLESVPFGLYASPIYLALHPAPGSPAGLDQHLALRLAGADGRPMAWRLSRGRQVWEAVPPGRATLNSPDMIQRLLLDGAGVGALPRCFAAEDVLRGQLVPVLEDWRLPDAPAWLVMPSRRFLPARVRAFIDHLVATVGETP